MCLILSVPAFAQANSTSYSDVYITITDALINTKQNHPAEVEQALAEFETFWSANTSPWTAEKQTVDEAFQTVQQATSKEQAITALENLSKAVKQLDNLENPIDEQAERDEFERKYTPYMKQFEAALLSADLDTILVAYKNLNVKWNQYEQPIRSQSIGMYGKIETQLAFIRITLASEEVNLTQVQTQYELFKSYIDQFLADVEVEVEVSNDSLQSLVDLIDDASHAMAKEDYVTASGHLKEFIMIWPNVEMEVSTRNGKLYTELESHMPILVSELMRKQVNVEQIETQLKRFKTEIQLLQTDADYTFWDSALILLREGLEALLIIMVLVAFLKRSKQEQMIKWIYTGAAMGIFLSIGAAIALSFFFNALTTNSSREVLEGYIGLFAAVMMIGVGIWLHNKSNVASWNKYLSKQMGHAISKGSVIAMASISFLSVFREGAETIIFYVGIAPNMETGDFILGLVVAVILLIIVAFVLFKMSVRIPLHKFFFIATIFIYLLAFKIIGSSIHTLQLTDVLPTNVLHGLPVFSKIGFYPTVETIIGQSLLIIIWLAVSFYQRQHSRESVSEQLPVK